MIHEFAVEPELAATWGSLSEYRHFVKAFGLGTTRVVSRYPKGWKRLVWEALKTTSELDRKRLEVLLEQISPTMVRRAGNYDPGPDSWLPNAIKEDARSPFGGILAREGSDNGRVIGVDHVSDAAAWNCANGIACSRTTEELAKALAPMLRICRRVAFIDPYFGPDKVRHRRPLQAFLRAMIDRRPGDLPSEILVLTSLDKTGTSEFFASECQKCLPQRVPRDLTLVLRRLREREGGEKLHNRYVLTDVGGILFGTGLDEGEPGQTDDLSVLNESQHALRMKQYLSNDREELAFHAPEPDVVVLGTAA